MAVSEKSISDKIETTTLEEELRKEWSNNDRAFKTKYSHKEDLENLLKLAEELKEKCDSAKRQIRNARLVEIFFLFQLLSGLALDGFRIANSLEPIFGKFPSALIHLVTLSVIIVCEYNIREKRRSYLPDKFALSEVLQLLRETSNVIAEQDKWSVLSRAEFRIRLSRFNLEEKSKSVFNLFS